MLLGIDLGTTNVKATAGLPDGEIVGHGSVPVSLIPVGAQGIEQDIEEIWRATLKAIQLALAGRDAGQVRAIGVSSQGGALQLLDARNRPVGRVVSWLDSRGHLEDDRLTRKLGPAWFIEHLSHGRSGFAIGQLLRLRREQGPRASRACRVGFVGDVIVERLCGRRAQDGTSAALTLLYDPAKRVYEPTLLRRLRLTGAELPDLLSVRETAGGLLAPVARATGLPTGIPVAPAMHDQYAAALGAGVTRPGDVMFGAGTAWVLLALSQTLTPPVTADALVCHHVVDGGFGQILSLRTGGSAIHWAKEILGLQALAGRAFDALIQRVPPGAGGVGFWPFVTPAGATGLGADIRARFTGLQLGQAREHLMRAVIEGLAYELNRHLNFLRAAAWNPRRIVMCGGAAHSAVTPQIIADVIGLPVQVSAAGEEGLLGALLVARGLLEPKTSLKTLAAQVTRAFKTFRPGAHAAAYRAAFAAYLKSLPPNA